MIIFAGRTWLSSLSSAHRTCSLYHEPAWWRVYHLIQLSHIHSAWTELNWLEQVDPVLHSTYFVCVIIIASVYRHIGDYRLFMFIVGCASVASNKCVATVFRRIKIYINITYIRTKHGQSCTSLKLWTETPLLQQFLTANPNCHFFCTNNAAKCLVTFKDFNYLLCFKRR